jgi:hypothetical protein
MKKIKVTNDGISKINEYYEYFILRPSINTFSFGSFFVISKNATNTNLNKFNCCQYEHKFLECS